MSAALMVLASGSLFQAVALLRVVVGKPVGKERSVNGNGRGDVAQFLRIPAEEAVKNKRANKDSQDEQK